MQHPVKVKLKSSFKTIIQIAYIIQYIGDIEKENDKLLCWCTGYKKRKKYVNHSPCHIHAYIYREPINQY